MFSTLTQRAAAATIEALTLGASDYVTKPEGHGSLDTAREVIRSQLVPKIRALCKRGAGGGPAARPRTSSAVPVMPASAMRAGTMHLPATGAASAPAPRTGTVRLPAIGGGAGAALSGGPARVVAIGISTGGPPALQTLLTALPRLPVPVLIVQHMPPDFTAMLAKRLSTVTPHAVTEAVDGAPIGPGQVWIAKGDHHLRVEAAGDGAVLRLDARGAPENSCRPAVDVLFRSVAELYGARTLGVVMTGMGQDGLRGAEVIRRGKGAVVIQDEASSVVWGMPGAVARAGQCDAVLPLAQLARELVRRTAAVGGAS
jgi:two-component system chemotaxis response regulator CheB